MIYANFFKEKNKHIAVKIVGHATGEHKEIVCAGVSTAIQFALIHICETNSISPRLINENGLIELDFKLNNSSEVLICQPVMQTLLVYLKKLEDQYNNDVKVVITNVQKHDY